MADLAADNTGPRREAAADAGLKSGVAFPVLDGTAFFGVIEFFALRRLAYDATWTSMMGAISSEIGQFIQRRNAEEALRRAHDELELRVRQRTAELEAANAKLQTSIVERRRLEHELLEITEKERRRIGLDLHDDLGQQLTGIALMTKGLEIKLQKEGAVAAEDASRIHQLVRRAMNHASDLAHDLATLDFKEDDLAEALGNLAAHTRKLFSIACRFRAEGLPPALDPNVISQLCKIAQEAVTNAIKHGKADHVWVGLSSGKDAVVLTIRNNGVPFPDLQGRGSPGMGLRIMNYRSNLVGASLEVKGVGESGTVVTCRLPFDRK
jgi:two-component system CheB/CheR fusion protein